MLFVKYLFSLLNGTAFAFRDGEQHFWKTSTKSEKSSGDGKLTGMKGFTGAGGPQGTQSAGFKYSPPGGLQGKWKHRWLPLWSIAKCLPGICLFNPLSKAIWASDVDGRRPAARRKSWVMGGRIHGKETHPPNPQGRAHVWKHMQKYY